MLKSIIMKRDETIDSLRGLAMFAMMVIHACSYYFDSRITLLIWDNLQWAVPVFLFCSFTLFYGKAKPFQLDNWLTYLRKRLSRLLVPYYYFLLVYFPLLFIFQKDKLSVKYFFSNITLRNGLDFNWLVLLFVYLIFLMPAVQLMRKNKPLFYGFFVLSLASSVYFIFNSFPYRMIMWLPWATLIYFTLFFHRYKSNKTVLLATAGLSLAVFAVLRMIEVNIGHNLTQYANKYPPTLYHLSFGFFWIIVLYIAAEKKIFNFMGFGKLLHFLSVNSYSLYFIHILVMFTISWLKLMPSVWPIFFLEIIGLSSLTQLSINRFHKA